MAVQLYANNATSTLASGILSGATSLTVQAGDGAKFPSPTGGDYFCATLTQGTGTETSWEIVQVTARSTDTFTIVRAQEGTTAAAWGAGSKVELRLTSAAIAGAGRNAAGGDLAGVFPNPSAFQAHLTDQAVPSAPASGTLILAGFNQQGFSVPHIYDTQGNATEITRDNITVCRNTTAGTISKGQVVYVTGSTGAVPTVALGKADGSATMPIIGVMYDTALTNAYGRVLLVGNLEQVDMSAFSNGDELYVSAATAGALTKTKPTYPDQTQFVGTVLNNGVGNGVLYVHPSDLVTGDAWQELTLAQFAATTSSQLAGVISDETGTGNLVFNNAPTLTNPVVGTQGFGDSSTKAASTAFVQTAIGNGPGGQPLIDSIGFYGTWILKPGSGSAASLVGGPTVTSAGTVTNPNITAASLQLGSKYTLWSSSTSANQGAGFLSAQPVAFSSSTSGLGGFYLVMRFSQQTNPTGGRAFIGVSATSSNFIGTSDPSTITNSFGVGYNVADSAAGNWQLYHSDGSVFSKTDLGSSAPRNTTDVYELVLSCPAGSTTITARLTNLTTNTVALADTAFASNVPVTGTLLFVYGMLGNAASGVAIKYNSYSVYLRTAV